MSNYSWQDDHDPNGPNGDTPEGLKRDPQYPEPDGSTDQTRLNDSAENQNTHPLRPEDSSASRDYGAYHYSPSPDDNQQNPYEKNYYHSNQYNSGSQYKEPGSPGMATAALVLGICSILFTCCGLGLPLGGIGIVLALLSRGKGKMTSSAQIGLGLSIGGAVLGILTFIMAMVYSIQIVKTTDWEDLMEYQYEYNMDDYDDLQDYFSDIDL